MLATLCTGFGFLRSRLFGFGLGWGLLPLVVLDSGSGGVEGEPGDVGLGVGRGSAYLVLVFFYLEEVLEHHHAGLLCCILLGGVGIPGRTLVVDEDEVLVRVVGVSEHVALHGILVLRSWKDEGWVAYLWHWTGLHCR